jgi:hypothetical protein
VLERETVLLRSASMFTRSLYEVHEMNTYRKNYVRISVSIEAVQRISIAIRLDSKMCWANLILVCNGLSQNNYY